MVTLLAQLSIFGRGSLVTVAGVSKLDNESEGILSR